MGTDDAREVELRDTVDPQTYGQAGSEGGLRQRHGGIGGGGVVPHIEENEFGMQLIFQEQEPLNADEARWAWYTVAFSAFDLIGSGVIICTGLKYAYFDGGVSLYSLALQAVSHWFSSLLLLLKFAGELRSLSDTQTSLLTRRRKQLYREQGLSIFMAIVMLMSAVALLFKAFRKLRFWNTWYAHQQRLSMETEIQEVTAWLAWTGFAIYVLQAVFRVVAARKLKNCLCTHGAVASVVSLIYLMVLGIAAKNEKEWTWKAEPVAAICLVVVMIIEGIRITFYYIDDMDSRLCDYSRA